MEENPTLESEAWGSSRGWLAPREARGAPCSSPGPSLSSVLNELPSAATLRYRDPGVLPWGALEEEEEDGGRSRKAFTEVTQTELQDPHPSRELPWPMQARRAHRQRNASRDQVVYGSGTKTDRWARLLRRSKEKTKEGLRSLQPWAWTLKRIGGQFGAGTESYFSLLRFLLLLNVLASVLMACMTLLPTWLGGAPPGPPGPDISSPCGSYNPHSQGLVTFATQLFNLLSGEGYLEWSPLFYGFYPPRPRLAVTYLCWAFAVGLICLLLILHRTVFLRLASLVVLLFSLWNQITCGGDSEAEDCKTCGYNYKQLPCWETVLGQEMYKLLLFDLLTVLAVALLIQFPRKLLCGLCPGALGRLAGTQEFQVPDEVLGLIYAQTVVWVGSFFCPLLPLLNTVKFLLLFYLKKLTLFSTCSPAARTFRASAANFFFPLVLLLGLAISSVPLLYSIFLIPPSKLCGPFRGQSSIWAQIPESISSLPETTQNFLFFLGTQAFAVPLLLISSILMAYTVALANSYGRLISELKRQRQTEAQNKVFLARRAVALTSTKPAL
ncbi:voltage-gated chloride channel TMC4 isoform X1 [Homo sapiens]|uniref:voltage-gated chloride channel TMC4 isoform X1 n=1 Tax=Homo sapiens TaxID=9606 RepID=UPI0005D03B0C|nr:transmembrane channel-like protein 4 isoform X1 [Homo sapiens]XP_054186431.1 transmembrane channel-like protein 4 isoform X1 [Homo sapiens]XP_054186684.1 transmembrane channel-like protein 4 isoform X1 [Homo sapiens]XP_054186915.1 transmembrane channel-like protein 4 isoform X1 [Homo sapiens]XP_054187193.1 transmembrane channel-like protein 4 isoform X1 [Homo sapiens]XP_054189504.1 transmembrane channel-like protein 4 isoform X1 [Homo sapiens]XP_054189602.1 transmembrane channel-like prote